MSASPDWPNAQRFAPLDDENEARWARFLRADRVFFPTYVGLTAEQLGRGYAQYH